MKISNFRDLKVLPSGKKVAKVDIETGWWVFKKVQTEYVSEGYDGMRWFLLSSGEMIQGYTIWFLHRGYTVRKEMEENAKI